jgi:diguanylate cyclase (GGDEF)-like protein
VRAELVAAAVAGDGLRIVPGDRRRHADAPAVRDAVARRRAVVRSVPPGLRTREDLDVAAAAPIRTGGRIWGALVAWPDARPGRETSLLSSLQQLADIAGLALDVASSRRRLAALALTDGLTGLPNARAVGDRLAEEVAHARRHGHALVLAEIDLDRFKLINDVHGHAAGDAVLRAVGAVLRQTARAGDVVGRVGGEEFVWVMRETGLADGVAAADRLRSRIAACGPTGAAAVTASIGIAALGPDDDARSLLAGADLAVYQAKADGRDVTRVCAVTGGVLDPAARSALVEHDRIVEGLRALARRRAGGPTLPSRWAARAGRAARAAGWSERDVRRLQDAAALTGVEPGLTSVVLDSEQTSWLAGRGHGGALLTAARAPEQEQAAA